MTVLPHPAAPQHLSGDRTCELTEVNAVFDEMKPARSTHRLSSGADRAGPAAAQVWPGVPE